MKVIATLTAQAFVTSLNQRVFCTFYFLIVVDSMANEGGVCAEKGKLPVPVQEVLDTPATKFLPLAASLRASPKMLFLLCQSQMSIFFFCL